eukprot:763129-Hanusia_phi.AAC.13
MPAMMIGPALSRVRNVGREGVTVNEKGSLSLAPPPLLSPPPLFFPSSAASHSSRQATSFFNVSSSTQWPRTRKI